MEVQRVRDVLYEGFKAETMNLVKNKLDKNEAYELLNKKFDLYDGKNLTDQLQNIELTL